MTVDIAPALLSGYLLALVRAAAWVFVCPPFGTRSVPTMVKVGLAAALALVAGPHLVDQAVPLEVGPMLAALCVVIYVAVSLHTPAMDPDVVGAVCWDHPLAFLKGRLNGAGDPRVVAAVLFTVVALLYWLLH